MSIKAPEQGIAVREFYEAMRGPMQLDLLAGEAGLDKRIGTSEINRPGLALAGFFEYFRPERVQVFGNGEIHYLNTLTAGQRRTVLERFLSFDLPCCVVSRGLDAQEDLVTLSEKRGVALFRSPLVSTKLISDATVFLENWIAPTMSLHGDLVEVFGLGVLILGESGIGKSECALDLVKRGHLLVADDVVHLSRRSGGFLVGSGGALIRHHMEVRGLGIIDVRTLFGMSHVLDETPVGLVVQLEMWDDRKEYERLGLESRTRSFLDVEVPDLVLPVRPGRSTAMLVEVAAVNQRIRKQGVSSAMELNRRVQEAIQKRGGARG